jgi:uncharacterized peroxidase-related enzyme
VHAIASDWRTADLPQPERHLCALAEKLTDDPRCARAEDLDVLRTHGFDDRAIHDAVQIIAYFNYITRVADGLGIEEEAGIHRWGEAHGGPSASEEPHAS